jgi:RHS repeat-associated protein
MQNTGIFKTHSNLTMTRGTDTLKYYAFGSSMKDRSVSISSKAYRFGFNGMEKTNEVYGDENEYTTEFRQIDVRLGRWISIDPAFNILPNLTPYNAFCNNPIIYIDPKGLWHIEVNGKGAKKREYIVGDKGDNLTTLDDFLTKLSKKGRFSIQHITKMGDDAKKDLIEWEKTNGPISNYKEGQGKFFENYKYNTSESLDFKINIWIGRTIYEGPDTKNDDPNFVGNNFKGAYWKLGGHVGVEIDGIVYNYYYNEPYDANPFKLFNAQMYTPNTADYMTGDGSHAYANGDVDKDGVHDVIGHDSYFTVYLTSKQYSKLKSKASYYSSRPSNCPKYGIFGKRCTSMANTMLRKSDIHVVFLSVFKTFHPHQYYKALKRKGYVETTIR